MDRFLCYNEKRLLPMSQTLLAVGGAALLALLALQSHRHRAQAGRDAIGIEVSAMTARVATDALNALRALPYDGAVLSGSASSPSALTPHRPLGPTSTRFDSLGSRAVYMGTPAPGTLDAADGRADTLSRMTAQGQLRFSVESVVGYVTADGQAPSLAPGMLKMASVRVWPVGVQADTLIVSQLYACGIGCAWSP